MSTDEIGYHVGCGGRVVYQSSRSYGRRACMKCGADGRYGRPSPEVVETKELAMKKEEIFTTLELTLDEADTLFHLMRYIGGSSIRSRRKHADSIYDKLREEFTVRTEVANCFEGAIMCKEDNGS